MALRQLHPHSLTMSCQEMCVLLFIRGKSLKNVADLKHFIEQSFDFECICTNPFVSLQIFEWPEEATVTQRMLLDIRKSVGKCDPPKEIFFEEKLQVTAMGGKVILPVRKDWWLERLFSELYCIVPNPQNFYFRPHVTLGKALTRHSILQLSDSCIPKTMGLQSAELEPFVSISKRVSPEKVVMFAPFGTYKSL